MYDRVCQSMISIKPSPNLSSYTNKPQESPEYQVVEHAQSHQRRPLVYTHDPVNMHPKTLIHIRKKCLSYPLQPPIVEEK